MYGNLFKSVRILELRAPFGLLYEKASIQRLDGGHGNGQNMKTEVLYHKVEPSKYKHPLLNNPNSVSYCITHARIRILIDKFPIIVKKLPFNKFLHITI